MPQRTLESNVTRIVCGSGDRASPEKGVSKVDVHSLLASRLVVREQIRTFVERLTDSGNVAVAEDPEAAAEERAFHPVPLGVLLREEAYERLRRPGP